MKDIIGQEITAGDKVVHTGGSSAPGRMATVVRVTSKKVTLTRKLSPHYNYKFSVFPDTVVVITKLLPI